MSRTTGEKKKYGLLKPVNDAHTLGISNVEELIKSCGSSVVVAPEDVCSSLGCLANPESRKVLLDWLLRESITDLGFSYRLDPNDAVSIFDQIYCILQESGCFRGGGRIRNLFFAALPPACDRIAEVYKGRVECFYGDETPIETALKLGLSIHSLPEETASGAEYDEGRLAFARDLVKSGSYDAILPPDRSGYPEFGSDKDNIGMRVDHSRRCALPPVMRAHVGPYLPNRTEAVHMYLEWAKILAEAGYLDVLSIGTSQLTQEKFGQEWGDMPNGGGVPINSEEEFRALWNASRPMLVRTYAGTSNIPSLAAIYERSINIAWHALSFWWFCATDGRGPLPLRENLKEHFETAGYIATTGKPLEPNVPHHFSFRGGDDITYIVSGILGARAAAAMGVRTIVIQTMLNTPKATWGLQDLAKARVLLRFARRIPGVRVMLQPRAGLDYFSHNLDKAKVQLAAVTAMMDDIEPDDWTSPDIIHVVSYSEAVRLADPDVVNESIKITMAALRNYRQLKKQGTIADISQCEELKDRERQLEQDVALVLDAIEQSIDNPYSPEGFYDILRAGFLQAPYLWMCRDEFAETVRWKTKIVKGGVCVVDDEGKPVSVRDRTALAVQNAMINKQSANRK